MIQQQFKIFFLVLVQFNTDHVGIDSSGIEYTDAIWVYRSKDLDQWDAANKAVVLDSAICTWSKGVIGMPSVIGMGYLLAVLYDGYEGNDKGYEKKYRVGVA